MKKQQYTAHHFPGTKASQSLFHIAMSYFGFGGRNSNQSDPRANVTSTEFNLSMSKGKKLKFTSVPVQELTLLAYTIF